MKNKAVVKMPQKQPGIADHTRQVLELLGEDATREGLVRTPERYEKAMRFITSGYHKNLDEIVNGAIFQVKCDEMVIIRDIEFFSSCEHHLLPFFGKMHVACILPKGDKVIGIEQDPAHCRYVLAQTAVAGAADAAGGRGHRRGDFPARRRRSVRSAAFLHDDARC